MEEEKILFLGTRRRELLDRVSPQLALCLSVKVCSSTPMTLPQCRLSLLCRSPGVPYPLELVLSFSAPPAGSCRLSSTTSLTLALLPPLFLISLRGRRHDKYGDIERQTGRWMKLTDRGSSWREGFSGLRVVARSLLLGVVSVVQAFGSCV